MCPENSAKDKKFLWLLQPELFDKKVGLQNDTEKKVMNYFDEIESRK